jgi:hypothetical protein
MELFFVRHGEHGGEVSALTEQGKDEMLEVGENIGSNDTVIVFYPPGERFVKSAQIILGEKDSEYKRKEVRQLSYMKIDTSTPYYKSLIDSIRAKRCLEFHILQSDGYIRESGENISSYTTMAALTSRLLLKYIDIQNRLPEDRRVDIQRVFCAREFVWACFRSKIIEIKNGRDEMFRYLEWYTNTQEGNPDARKSIARVFSGDLYKNGVIKISDVYGDEEFTIDELNLILQQEQELLETASIKV